MAITKKPVANEEIQPSKEGTAAASGKAVAAALQESEIRYRRLFESAKDGIMILDAETGMVNDVNPFLMKLLGYSYEQVVGKTIWELGFIKDIVANKDNFEELQSKEYVRYEDMPLETADGRRIEVEFVSNVYLVNNQKVIQCLIRDITERREIENGLEKARKELERIKISEDEAREYSESIINTVREPLIVLNQDLRVVTASRSFYEVFKVTPKETIGQLIYDLGNKQWDIPKLRELLETILPQKTAFDGYEVERDFAVIGSRIMLLNARQIQRVSGKERIILLSIEDITERKLAEDELKKHRIHLEELVTERTEELARSVKNLERSNQELEQFAYVASHDLQEPLRMISSFTQLLAQRYPDKLDSDANDFIRFAVDGANRMQRLINDLLAYSRVASRGKRPETMDPHSALGEALANLNTAIQESGALITNEELPEVLADRSQIIQVFQNLVGNAIKFRGEDPPRIHVSAARGDGEWVFTIKDNGIGIEPQYFDQIFVIFQRLHGREEYSGTGIGLALCKRIIDRNGGRIWLESRPGEGSSFYFTIPIKERKYYDGSGRQ